MKSSYSRLVQVLLLCGCLPSGALMRCVHQPSMLRPWSLFISSLSFLKEMNPANNGWTTAVNFIQALSKLIYSHWMFCRVTAIVGQSSQRASVAPSFNPIPGTAQLCMRGQTYQYIGSKHSMHSEGLALGPESLLVKPVQMANRFTPVSYAAKNYS